MKKVYSLFVLLLVSLVARAADGFTVSKIDMKPGETAVVAVNLTNEQETQSVSIDITLSEGLSFVDANGDVVTGGDNSGVVFSERTSVFQSKSARVNANTGWLRTSMVFGTMPAGEGELFTFRIQASASASIGIVTIQYTGQKITYGSTTVKIDDKTSDVNIYDVYKVIVAANDAAMGTVTGGTDEAMSGTPLTVKATPAAGYAFVAWKDGDTQVSTDAEYTFTPTKDVTLTAIFEASTHITQHSSASSIPSDLFTLTGTRVRSQATNKDVQLLPAGLYIIRGKKVMIK